MKFKNQIVKQKLVRDKPCSENKCNEGNEKIVIGKHLKKPALWTWAASWIDDYDGINKQCIWDGELKIPNNLNLSFDY